MSDPGLEPDESFLSRDAFWTALMFYTRLPVPSSYRYRESLMDKSSPWLPVVGWIIALLCGLGGGLVFLAVLGLAWAAGLESGFWAQLSGTPTGMSDLVQTMAQDSHQFSFEMLLSLDPVLGWVAAGLGAIAALAVSLLVTGAFHEDGFADLWDGFGGGMGNRERTLEIMKDSRLGTFGGAGLFLLLLSRIFIYAFLLYSFCTWQGLWWGLAQWLVTLVFCQSLARMVPLLIMMKSSYARSDASSKSKPIAKSLSPAQAVFGLFAAVLPLPLMALMVLHGWVVSLALAAAMPLAAGLCRNWFESVLGGYTGDCLGASEQIAEVLCLAVCVAALAGVALQGPGLESFALP